MRNTPRRMRGEWDEMRFCRGIRSISVNFGKIVKIVKEICSRNKANFQFESNGKLDVPSRISNHPCSFNFSGPIDWSVFTFQSYSIRLRNSPPTPRSSSKVCEIPPFIASKTSTNTDTGEYYIRHIKRRRVLREGGSPENLAANAERGGRDKEANWGQILGFDTKHQANRGSRFLRAKSSRRIAHPLSLNVTDTVSNLLIPNGTSTRANLVKLQIITG